MSFIKQGRTICWQNFFGTKTKGLKQCSQESSSIICLPHGFGTFDLDSPSRTVINRSIMSYDPYNALEELVGTTYSFYPIE